MADVFISYSKGEPVPTKWLAAALEARGYTVWWDTNVLTGENFREKILRELANAKTVIVIWSKTSVNSEWVISEAELAKRSRKLVPVRTREIEHSDIPPPFGLLHTDLYDDLERIIRALHVLRVYPTLVSKGAIVAQEPRPKANPLASAASARDQRVKHPPPIDRNRQREMVSTELLQARAAGKEARAAAEEVQRNQQVDDLRAPGHGDHLFRLMVTALSDRR